MTPTASSMTACACRTAAAIPLRVRSIVGLIPVFAVDTIEPARDDALPDSGPHGMVRAAPA